MSAEPQASESRRLLLVGQHVNRKINTVHTDSSGIFHYIAVPVGQISVVESALVLSFRVNLGINTKRLSHFVTEWRVRNRASSAPLPNQFEAVWRAIDHDLVDRASPLGVWPTQFGLVAYVGIIELEGRTTTEVSISRMSFNGTKVYPLHKRSVAGCADNADTIRIVTDVVSELLGAAVHSVFSSNTIESSALDLFMKKFWAPASLSSLWGADQTASGVLQASIIFCRVLGLPEPNAVLPTEDLTHRTPNLQQILRVDPNTIFLQAQ